MSTREPRADDGETRKAKAKPADDFDYVLEKDEEAITPLRARKRDWRALLETLRSNETYEDLEKIERDADVAKTADARRRIPTKTLGWSAGPAFPVKSAGSKYVYRSPPTAAL